MHSRVFQLGMSPIEKDDYITESDFEDESGGFLGPIADYVSNECDRDEDIAWLLQRIEPCGAVYNKEEGSIVFNEGFKEKYFEAQWDRVKDTITSMTLKTFATDSQAIYNIKSAVEDKFGFYVYFDSPECFDSFVRDIEIGEKYYFGATVDYHY